MTNLWFINRVPENIRQQFANKVKAIANRFSIQPNWLMMIMELESGINPKALNSSTNATGLIQFMPSTAIGLGTDINKLYNMNHVQQLDFVEKYFIPYAKYLKSGEDLYLAVFYPLALRKDDNYIFGSEVSMSYARTLARQNPLFSKFSNTDTLDKRTWRIAMMDYVTKKLNDIKKVNFFFSKKNIVVGVIIGGLSVFFLYKLYKQQKNK
jgi:hypothetical protein